MKRLTLILIFICALSSILHAQIDTTKWKFNPNKTDNKYDKVLNKDTLGGKAPGSISGQFVYNLSQTDGIIYVKQDLKMADWDSVDFRYSNKIESPQNYFLESIYLKIDTIVGEAVEEWDFNYWYYESFYHINRYYDTTFSRVFVTSIISDSVHHNYFCLIYGDTSRIDNYADTKNQDKCFSKIFPCLYYYIFGDMGGKFTGSLIYKFRRFY